MSQLRNRSTFAGADYTIIFIKLKIFMSQMKKIRKEIGQ